MTSATTNISGKEASIPSTSTTTDESVLREAEVDNEAEDNRIGNDPNVKPTPAPFHASVHWLVHTMQRTHGIIPHQDYSQYRKYCTRKLHRLRRCKEVGGRELLHGNGGRGKHGSSYVPRPHINHLPKNDIITQAAEEDINNGHYSKVNHVNFLLILLVSAERCWTHAMEVKADYDTRGRKSRNSTNTNTNYTHALSGYNQHSNNQGKSRGKLRKQFLRKLRKAAQYATALHTMACHVATDEETRVECHAYASWMRGNLALEQNQFHVASREYTETLTAIQLCRQQTSSLELQDYFTNREEYTVEPLRAYCYQELQLQQPTKDEVKSISIGTATTATNTTALTSTSSLLLQYKLEEKREEQRRAETSKSNSKYGTITYRGIPFPVDQEELRLMLCKIDELVQSWKKSRNEDDEQDEDNAFVQLLNAYDEAVKFCSFQCKELEQMASGKTVNATKRTYICLKGYLLHQKIVVSMERNEAIIAKKTRSSSIQDWKVEELAHIYDLLLQDARKVLTLPSAHSNGLAGIYDSANSDTTPQVLVEQEPDDDDFALEANAHILRFRAFKCYYTGHWYARNEKVKETYRQTCTI